MDFFKKHDNELLRSLREKGIEYLPYKFSLQEKRKLSKSLIKSALGWE